MSQNNFFRIFCGINFYLYICIENKTNRTMATIEIDQYFEHIGIHCNTFELHKKLENIGYQPLNWTVSTREGSWTVVTNHYMLAKGYGPKVYYSDSGYPDIDKANILVAESEDEFFALIRELEEKDYITRKKSVNYSRR